ncbi:tRNA pseudouridine synthase D [Sulfodiicoccus acidiphilus]|uniref:tRNA pseudouridine synthase D n=1 Tax=Sulfodiicoccus acidiphilus TaxID=1670455 RepID=A0A348B2P8_9CREN|nr:tRNA pseudouridine(13) synthase TruD [Sulfodiicoccus acidiphilus]BBD72450.1 tRNA pseudouridine synthase D [Sulfodiicoccus acidiphilus]GGT97055.1 tRNA pseudouridine synthase D [Sulfodiicoccus acidiphilus]
MDLVVGMETYFINSWPPLLGKVVRPEGFKVRELVDGGTDVSSWKGGEDGKLAVYLLWKEGRDHFSVVRELASVLRAKPSYMGIKDADAVTLQLLTVPNMPNLPQVVEGRGFVARLVGRTNVRPSHYGNRFNITLDIEDTGELHRRANEISALRILPAFIGYQRFGTRRPVTHVIGKLISQRDWCGALSFLVSRPFLGEGPQGRAFREAVQRGELEKALELIPSYFKQERVVLSRYTKTSNCLEALKASLVPPAFFVEAYQSYLFNRYLSRVIHKSKRDTSLRLSTNFNECDEDCREIYLEEGIEKDSFRVKELKVSLRPIVRRAFMEVRDLEVIGNVLMFSLERGMYASVVLREILRGDPRLYT